MKEDLELMASKEFKEYAEMYKVVDFLNKNLSNRNIVFGLQEKDGKCIINIYKEK